VDGQRVPRREGLAAEVRQGRLDQRRHALTGGPPASSPSADVAPRRGRRVQVQTAAAPAARPAAPPSQSPLHAPPAT
jgi:hypothetical protein